MKTNKYIEDGKWKISYVTDDDIDREMNLEEKDKFRKWISGQTCPVVEIHGKPTMAYFKHDVDRFLDEIRHGIRSYFD